MFVVFAGDKYYPYGGIEDLYSKYSTLEEASSAVKRLIEGEACDWAQIVEVTGTGLYHVESVYR